MSVICSDISVLAVNVRGRLTAPFVVEKRNTSTYQPHSGAGGFNRERPLRRCEQRLLSPLATVWLHANSVRVILYAKTRPWVIQLCDIWHRQCRRMIELGTWWGSSRNVFLAACLDILLTIVRQIDKTELNTHPTSFGWSPCQACEMKTLEIKGRQLKVFCQALKTVLCTSRHGWEHFGRPNCGLLQVGCNKAQSWMPYS